MLESLGTRVDEDLLGSFYRAASLDAEQIRVELRASDLPFHDPATGRTPTRDQLTVTAEAVIARTARRATLRGALGGFVGALSIPPEIAAAVVESLRLAQRLSVVYGFDPDTDQGRLLLSRAVARAWDVDTQLEGTLGLTLRELSMVLRARLPAVQSVTARLARSVAIRAAVSSSRRMSRILPGVGAGMSGWHARRSAREQGDRMRHVFERAWEGTAPFEGTLEEAVEVPL